MASRPRQITILGSGLAGLTAGINLALRGVQVEIHEKRGEVGSRSKGDFQGLENWTSPQDALAFLSSIHIPPDFDHEPFHECCYFDHALRRYPVKSHRPGFYLVRRGPMEGTLDRHLKEVAARAGVVFHPNASLPPERADIIATGRRESFIIAKGLNFDTDLDKLAYAILDDRIVPYGYAYLLGLRGRGTLAVVSKAGTSRLDQCLERAVARFRTLASFEMRNAVPFGGAGTRYRGPMGGIPRVGEAAGFQDAMWGFGMRLAFHSGHLAAQALLEGQDYWALVEREVAPLCRSSVVNRMLYDWLKARRYAHILDRLAKAADPVTEANRLYAPSPLKGLLFPLANLLAGGKPLL